MSAEGEAEEVDIHGESFSHLDVIPSIGAKDGACADFMKGAGECAFAVGVLFGIRKDVFDGEGDGDEVEGSIEDDAEDSAENEVEFLDCGAHSW